MQLQQHLDRFTDEDIRVFAVSYDPQPSLAAFAEEFGITYSLLSDPESEVIRRFGILNTLVQPEEKEHYGIPYPGSYLVDRDGTVMEKLFHQHYRTRDTAQSVLRDRFGAAIDLGDNPRASLAAEDVRLAAQLSADSLIYMQRAMLYVRMDLNEGLHVYGSRVPEGFVPTTVRVNAPDGVRVDEPSYPSTRPFRVEGIDETFHVLDGAIEIGVPISSDIDDRTDERATEGATIPLDVSVRYQACDVKQCYLPQTRTLHLDIPIGRLTRRHPQ